MKEAPESSDRPKPTVKLILEACNAAAREAVEVHRRAGLPMAVWQDGQVVLIPAPPLQPDPVKPKRRRRKP